MFSHSVHFLSQVRHCKADSLQQFERKLFLDVILISQSRENRPRLTGPLVDAMLQSTTSKKKQKRLPIEPVERSPLLKIGRISLKQVHIKRILSVFFPFTLALRVVLSSLMSTRQLTLESISSCCEQHNLKIINLF